jgi:hypothetical protein
MKIIKGFIIAFIILISLGILFRGSIYRSIVKYKSVGIRTNYAADNPKLLDYINTSVPEQADMTIKQIIEAGLSLTSRQLNFTADKNQNDPNKLISLKTAHCIGYASFFATSCNNLLEKNNLSNSWKAIPRIGKIFVFGTNIHNYLNSPFFKDHDFVTIENNRTGEVFAVDPTIHEYLSIDYITYIIPTK